MKKFENYLSVIGIVIMIAVMLPIGVYGYQFDNVASDLLPGEGYGSYIITNSFGLGDDLLKITLMENTWECGESFKCFAVINVEIYEPSKLIDEVNFKKLNQYGGTWDNFDPGSVDVELQTVEEIKEVNQTLVIKDYIPYDNSELPPGNYTFRLSSGIKRNSVVDWIGTWLGVEIKEWAVWNGTGTVGIENWWTLNNSYNSSTGIYNFTFPQNHNTRTSFVAGPNGGPTGPDFGDAIHFNGTTQGSTAAGLNYSQPSLLSDLSVNNGTIEFWINFSGNQNPFTSYSGLYDTQTTGGGVAIQILYFDNHSIRMRLNDGDGGVADYDQFWCTKELKNDLWYHLAFSWNQTSITLYVNGTEETACIKPRTKDGDLWEIEPYGHFFGGDKQNINSNAVNGPINASYDEIMIFSVYRNSSDVQSDMNYTPGGGAGPAATIAVTQVWPGDFTVTNNATYSFNCSAEGTGANVDNITFRLYNNSVDSDPYAIQVEYTNAIAINSSVYNLDTTVYGASEVTTLWSCEARADDGTSFDISANRTFTYDGILPNISVTNLNRSYFFPPSITFNWSVNDTNLTACWYTLSYNLSNHSVTCGANGTIMTELAIGNHSLRFYANDSVGNENSTTTLFNITSIVSSVIYNATVYETGLYPYKINYAADGTVVATSSTLFWNGTTYSTAQSGNNTNIWFNRTLSIPVLKNGTTNFNWMSVFGGATYNTSIYNQNVSKIKWGICNNTNTVPFLTLIYLDETNNTQMNATLPATSWQYYLSFGNVSANKSYSYVNNSIGRNTSFCFTPPWESTRVDYTISYTSTGYQQRSVSASSILFTNTTTNTNLYLLNSVEGSYTTFITQTASAVPIQGVSAIAERNVGGTWTTVESGTTDGSGSVTFWVDPDITYRFTFWRTGYTTVTTTIRPTQSLYTITMGSSAQNASFSTNLLGLSWDIGPTPGYLNPNTNFTFYFNLTALQSDVDSCNMTLRDARNGTWLGGASGCNSQGGNISVSMALNFSTTGKIFASYGVDKGNGTFIIEGGRSWFTLNYTAEQGTLITGLTRLGRLPMFGDDARHDFSRIVFFFFSLTLILGAICYKTSMDVRTRGGAIVLLTGLIWIGSFAGFLYLEGVSFDPRLDKYAIALLITMAAVGYILNVLGRDN